MKGGDEVREVDLYGGGRVLDLVRYWFEGVDSAMARVLPSRRMMVVLVALRARRKLIGPIARLATSAVSQKVGEATRAVVTRECLSCKGN